MNAAVTRQFGHSMAIRALASFDACLAGVVLSSWTVQFLGVMQNENPYTDHDPVLISASMITLVAVISIWRKRTSGRSALLVCIATVAFVEFYGGISSFRFFQSIEPHPTAWGFYAWWIVLGGVRWTMLLFLHVWLLYGHRSAEYFSKVHHVS